MVEAAALPECFFTVWSNVWVDAELGDGALLVHGGNSGVGVAAIKIAAALGNPVYATATSDEKCEACLKLGAASAINTTQSDFVAAISSVTGGRGVDVVIDILAGDFTDRNLQALAAGGRLAIVYPARGAMATINLMTLMSKRLRIMGALLRPRSNEYKALVARQLLEHVWPHIDGGSMRPLIDSTFRFSDVASAHARLETRRHIGKVILTEGA
jgi:NADPH:quinone reductase